VGDIIYAGSDQVLRRVQLFMMTGTRDTGEWHYERWQRPGRQV